MKNFVTDFLLTTYHYFGIGVLITILLFLSGWLLYIARQRDKRYHDFKKPFLPLIEILENRTFPKISRAEHASFFDKMFSAQDDAILTVKTRMKRKRRDILNQKWDEYKKKREPYKNRDFTAYLQFEQQTDKFSDLHLIEDDNLIKLINEILKIAKKN